MTLSTFPPAVRRAAAIYALLCVVNIVCAYSGVRVGEDLTKPLLMPLLAVVAWLAARELTRGGSGGPAAEAATGPATGTTAATAADTAAEAAANSTTDSATDAATADSTSASPGSPTSLRLPLAGILLGGAGDTALMGSGTWFLLGMGCFAAGHVCYLTAARRHGALAAVRTRPAVLGAYAAVWLALLAATWSGLGALRIPVIGYSLLLVGMAISVSGLSRVGAAGGALFVVSDGFIALGIAKVHLFPHESTVVMPTYVVAQFLIALAFVAAHTARAAGIDRGAAYNRARMLSQTPGTSSTATSVPSAARSVPR